MAFTLQQEDLRPDFDLHQWIFADGELTPGTAERFHAFVEANPGLLDHATVYLNSPGGSVDEGIALGTLIRRLHYSTNVGLPGSKPMTVTPGLSNRFQARPRYRGQ